MCRQGIIDGWLLPRGDVDSRGGLLVEIVAIKDGEVVVGELVDEGLASGDLGVGNLIAGHVVQVLDEGAEAVPVS